MLCNARPVASGLALIRSRVKRILTHGGASFPFLMPCHYKLDEVERILI
jgi:hypothetical protein